MRTRTSMEHEEREVGDKCVDGKCWSGPMLVIGTRGGTIPDLSMWIKIMLSKQYSKAVTLGMMSHLVLTHIFEEHTILAFSVAREPAGSVLREIYVRVMLDHDGELKSNTSTYRFAINGEEGEQERCSDLMLHYGWIESMANRVEQ